ncbi:MAG TPA: FHA domain-containing protein [Planctomycetota bacterium]|nr:FHA domain-containing protein [Planctomycetota bacterium]
MGLLKTKRDGKLVAYRLDKAAVIVGSGENCNIRVADMGLVSRHCQILKMENGFVLRDMSGDAGTFVNGKKVKEHLLSDRDLIQVGKERFTFALSEGENTARVAVSVAPAVAAPAKSGNTARMAAAAPPPAAGRSGNTGRIAAAAPKTERAEVAARTTGRVAAAAPEGAGRTSQGIKKTTGRTGTVQKTTGRSEAVKKTTGRSAASMGYQTQRAGFAMPSTRKGKLIAIGGVLLILAIGGIFYLINAGQVKPDEVRAKMKEQWKDVVKLKPGQEIEMDALIEKILAEHEHVRRYINEDYTKFEKEHTKVHQVAAEQRKAAKEVKPFLDKYAGLKGKPDLKAQAQALYDENKSLIDSYGGTAYVEKLREIQTELQVVLSETGPTWESEIVGLQREVQVAVKKGDCAGAAKVVTDFGTKHNEKEKLQLFAKLNEEREMIKRQSDAFVKRETDRATKELATEGANKADIKKRLEGYKAGLEGYPAALEKLEAAIAGIK